MSIKVLTWVWEHSEEEGGALLVLLALADWANDDGSRIFPSIASAAKKSRLSERQVQRILRLLEGKGTIAKEIDGGGRGKTTSYRILLKGDTMSPFKERVTSERVTSATGKGDICDIKRVTPMSPDPSLDPSEDPSNTNTFDPFSEKREVLSSKPDTFLPFWTKYPRKENKPAARRAWLRLNPLDQASAISRVLVLNQQGWGCEDKFIPHPASWLNGRRWEDEIRAAPARREVYIPTAKDRDEEFRREMSANGRAR